MGWGMEAKRRYETLCKWGQQAVNSGVNTNTLQAGKAGENLGYMLPNIAFSKTNDLI